MDMKKMRSNRVVTALIFRCLGAMLVLPLMVGVGHAQSPNKTPRIWIGPVQATDGVAGAGMLAAKIDAVMRKQLRGAKTTQMWNEGHLGPIAAGEADPRVEEAEGLRFSGKEAYKSGQYDAAIESLSAAV
jgi:hypothetical protein